MSQHISQLRRMRCLLDSHVNNQLHLDEFKFKKQTTIKGEIPPYFLIESIALILDLDGYLNPIEGAQLWTL